MPIYKFNNEKTNAIETHFINLSDIDQFKIDHPYLKQRISAPNIGDSVRCGVSKNPESFNQLLKNIKNRYHKSTIEI